MLDFQEVQRRIMQRHCDCGACSPDDVPYSAIVEPIIMQLDSSTETLLLTPNERCNLASMLRRQSEMLDNQSAVIDNLHAIDERNDLIMLRIKRGLIGFTAVLFVITNLVIGHSL